MKTRETKKSAYISNFILHYINELKNTIFVEEGQIELKATNQYQKRKEDIKDKADALMYGILDAKKEAERIKATL